MDYAGKARSRFDTLARRASPIGVVSIAAIANAIVIGAMGMLERRSCGVMPVSILDLELTFSATRFETLLGLMGTDACRSFVRWNFVTLDVLFPVVYAIGLCALFLWMERQRRFNADGTPTGDLLPFRNDLFVAAPLAAGFIDIVFENIPLWLAAILLNRGLPADSAFASVLVWIGSIGAAMKWTLVLVAVLAIVAELLSCSRGNVLRRLRFSVLAVLLGALPLLVVPQGQEILQRVVEGDEPAGRIASALLALTFAAQVVWFCGRKLVQMKFAGDVQPNDGNWYDFFAEHLPRILGIAVLALAGGAFARAGAALSVFVGGALAGYMVVIALMKWQPGILSSVGRLAFVFAPHWKIIGGLDTQIGRAIVASLIGFLIIVVPSELNDEVPRDFMLLRETGWLFLVTSWGFYLYVYFRRGRIAARLAGAAPQGQMARYTFEVKRVAAEAVACVDARTLSRGVQRGIITGVIVSVAAISAFTLWPVESARTLGSLVILSLAVSSVVFFGSIAAWVYGRFRIPVVATLIAFAVLFSVWNENHVVRKLGSGSEQIDNRPDIASHLARWRSQDSSVSESPVILVAASGGGLRAAYWTAASLAALQNTNHAFNRHLFAISSVSGGSLGAAVYTAIVRDVERSDSSIVCRVNKSTKGADSGQVGGYHECVRNFMGQDFLSPVLARMVTTDFLQLFLPVPIKAFDRSYALERSWEKSYSEMTTLPTMSEGFLAVTRDPGATAPALFFNSTHVETGKRYVTSTLVRGDSTPPAGSTSRSMHDSRDLLDIIRSDIPLSTAVHNSARFAYVSPPGRIQRNDSAEYGHVVDGGYFENFGLATLREVLDVVMSQRASPRGGPSLVPIVLYLCNDPVPCSDGGSGDTVLTARRSAVVEWAGPVRALLRTRDARGSLARADMSDVEGIHFVQLNVCDALLAVESTSQDGDELLESTSRRERGRERIISPPLGWLLSKVARDWMDASLAATDGTGRPSQCRIRNARAIATIDSLLRLN